MQMRVSQLKGISLMGNTSIHNLTNEVVGAVRAAFDSQTLYGKRDER